VSRARATIELEAPIAEVEALWYDERRWPAFVDGFRQVAKREGGWPGVGGVLVWDAHPGGRGRVVERVTEHAAGDGQVAAIEDERLRGAQRVRFASRPHGSVLVLELEYALKGGGPLSALADRLFIRRAVEDSLRRTVRRFGLELAADRELLR